MVLLEDSRLSEAEELTQQMEDLKEKLVRAQRQLAGLKEKGKYLRMQYDDARTREKNTTELVMELLERQRELNVMLNRGNIMLNRTQEVMALTSIEFNEMAKALPEPRKAEWSDRVSRINELFKKSGIQDAEMVEDTPAADEAQEEPAGEVVTVSPEPEDGGNGGRPEELIAEDSLLFPPRRKSWWRHAVG